ncbi:MAG: hypothetical protein JNK82_13285 [Myxococcaceae bacterium]|nr:hypothetical protein [Myxococcaceae bacterium]
MSLFGLKSPFDLAADVANAVKKAASAGAAAPAKPAAPASNALADALTSLKSSFDGAVAAKATQRAQTHAQLVFAGLAEDQISSTMSRLELLPPEAAQRELSLLKTAAAEPNGARAVAAWGAVHDLASESDGASARLTAQVREALVLGVAKARTPMDPTGQEGILGVESASRAAQALVEMPEPAYDGVSRLLGQAAQGQAASPKADAQTERALILKAVAARKERLTAPVAGGLFDKALDAAGLGGMVEALKEVSGFANDVRGMPQQELINSTTLLDVQSQVNTGWVEVGGLGVGPDLATDNDGLYQRYGSSCAPTTAQLFGGELDPVAAMRAHREGIIDPLGTGGTALQQRVLLTLAGGDSVTRHTDALSELDRNHIWDLGRQANLDPKVLNATWSYLKGSTDLPDVALGRLGIELIRRHSGGDPALERFGALRGEALKEAGSDTRDVVRMLTGKRLDYHEVWSRSAIEEQLPAVDAELQAGRDVPISVGTNGKDSGHAMLLSDVRGTGAARQYLVSDPWSGKTALIPLAELVDPASKWPDKHFGIGWEQLKGVIF